MRQKTVNDITKRDYKQYQTSEMQVITKLNVIKLLYLEWIIGYSNNFESGVPTFEWRKRNLDVMILYGNVMQLTWTKFKTLTYLIERKGNAHLWWFFFTIITAETKRVKMALKMEKSKRFRALQATNVTVDQERYNVYSYPPGFIIYFSSYLVNLT